MTSWTLLTFHSSEKQVLADRPFRAIVGYILAYKRAYAAGGVLALVFTAMELAAPLVMRAVVQRFETGRATVFSLWLSVGLLLAVALVAGAARFWQRTFMIGASRRMEYDLRNGYFRHVQGLSQDFFHRTNTGDVMARATNDLNYVRMFAGPGIMGSVDMLRVPFTIAIMLYLNIKLTLIGLLPVPFLSLFVYGFVMYMHRQSKKVQEQFSQVTTRVHENLAGARVVKAYSAADREIRVFRRECEKYMGESLKLSVVSALVWPLLELMITAVILVILWQGGIMVIREVAVLRPVFSIEGVRLESTVFTLGDFSGFLFCLVLLAFPLAEFGWVMTLYQRGAAGMKRILEIMTEVPTIRDPEHARRDVRGLSGAVRFSHVQFSYNGQPVLRDVDFEISPGQTVAIVGPTGSGKSTLVALLTRERDPSSGGVSLDGVDVRDIPLELLRAHLGCVPQDTFIFSDTIRANLEFGRPDASDAELDYACQIAQFFTTVREFPNGYETVLGERGVNLSGGQKQRLAIARALLRDPAILILDDALSSVDTQTEEEILLGLKEFMASRTCILISHRVSTIRHADQIFVLQDGMLVERGTHEALIERGGLYAAMYQRQLLEDRLEGA